ncbi:hypothetical protein NKH45_27420 [Mesorhizobium sp. M1156]|uniref:hypothetical protein n=1 Tax=Mesorhizobium sp. M1156 TaxID=2957064 RepID=UPI00333880B3
MQGYPQNEYVLRRSLPWPRKPLAKVSTTDLTRFRKRNQDYRSGLLPSIPSKKYSGKELCDATDEMKPGHEISCAGCQSALPEPWSTSRPVRVDAPPDDIAVGQYIFQVADYSIMTSSRGAQKPSDVDGHEFRLMPPPKAYRTGSELSLLPGIRF